MTAHDYGIRVGDLVRRGNVGGLVVVDVTGESGDQYAVIRAKSDVMGRLDAVPVGSLSVYGHLTDAELAAVNREIAELPG